MLLKSLKAGLQRVFASFSPTECESRPSCKLGSVTLGATLSCKQPTLQKPPARTSTFTTPSLLMVVLFWSSPGPTRPMNHRKHLSSIASEWTTATLPGPVSAQLPSDTTQADKYKGRPAGNWNTKSAGFSGSYGEKH